jgi:glutamate dehydrogenase
MIKPKETALSSTAVNHAVRSESKEFEKNFLWLEEHMPPKFFDEVDLAMRVIIARNLMSFQLQDYFAKIHLKNMGIILCWDGPDADLKTLKNIKTVAVRYYRTFISNQPPPGEINGKLRITILYFRDLPKEKHLPLDPKHKLELIQLIQERDPNFQPQAFEPLYDELTPRFVRSMKDERLALAISLFFRAKTRDQCQYEVRRNEDWEEKKGASLQVVLAWRDVPKAGFLYRMAKIIHGHNLGLRHMAAKYIDPYHINSIAILSLALHGLDGRAAWEVTDIDDLMREICLLKYFDTEDLVAETFVKTKLITGNEGHLVRNFASFVHQTLLYADPYLYSFDSILEGFCRHPELTVQLCKIFEAKFHPKKNRSDILLQKELVGLIDKLDTGHPINDMRRKNILSQALNFINHTLKTNFYRHNKTAFSFRLDPNYLDHLPFDRKEKFPELPYGIFFVRGMNFIGFNIRFRDLARGGVRTVTPERWESYYQERNTIFSEAYNLAFTQQKKNKDIPEGGSKTAILLAPYDAFSNEEEIFVNEMKDDGIDPKVLEEKIKIYRKEHKLGYLYASQRSFVESFVSIINCDEQGVIKAKDIIDKLNRPEYIYLGPDENMLNDMIVWIANYAVHKGYKPGRSFMSSKPGAGINHKEYGVTSYGVNVYLHQTLVKLGIDPLTHPFTVKISGGPDGDVAGNEIHILATSYAKTAKLIALTDGSGTIYDPEGLDWTEMDQLFKKGQPINCYNPEKLHETGFLLDIQKKREESTYVQQTLLWRKTNQKAVQEWISGNEMNHLYRNNVHKTPTDIFIPAGGRPRTLNETNISSYLDETGKPTSLAIVEGANLYLTPGARRKLELEGVLVLKDSSCNKGGVICSSFEVLAGLCLTEEEFSKEKPEYVTQVLELIQKAAFHEANLILDTHEKTGAYLTDISEKISERINLFKYQLLDYLETIPLSKDLNDPLIRSLLSYCPKLLRERYTDRILKMPDIHKKAIISVFLASHLVYSRGLDWAPSVPDVLESIALDQKIIGSD